MDRRGRDKIKRRNFFKCCQEAKASIRANDRNSGI